MSICTLIHHEPTSLWQFASESGACSGPRAKCLGGIRSLGEEEYVLKFQECVCEKLGTPQRFLQNLWKAMVYKHSAPTGLLQGHRNHPPQMPPKVLGSEGDLRRLRKWLVHLRGTLGELLVGAHWQTWTILDSGQSPMMSQLDGFWRW